MRRHSCFWYSFLLVWLPSSLLGQCRLDYSNYHKIFEDDFNYTNVIDLQANWALVSAEDTCQGWGNAYYSPRQVSLLPNGFVRLTATKLPKPLIDASRMQPFANDSQRVAQARRTLNYVSGKLESPLRADFNYGMFEIRCRLPVSNVGSWPALWLVSLPTEIDIVDNLMDEPSRHIRSNIIDWTVPESDPKRAYEVVSKRLNATDLSADFNTFTVVWTPTRITFFLNGLEMHTVDSSKVVTHGNKPLKIIANLDMARWSSALTAQMDIDYVRVYKPNDNNYLLPYKSSVEQVNHDINIFNLGAAEVNVEAGSVAATTGNPTQVFYRGKDDRLYLASLKEANQWEIQALPHPAGDANTLVKGDVIYNKQYGIVLYRGQDNRIQLFNFWNNAWHHSYANIKAHVVQDRSGSLTSATSGEIFYISPDYRIRCLHLVDGSWQLRRVRYKLGKLGALGKRANSAQGDILPTPDYIFYKGQDLRIQQLTRTTKGRYRHSWSDTVQTHKAADQPGALVKGEGETIYYVGADKQVYSLVDSVRDGTRWHHSRLPYTYGDSSRGYLDADYVHGGLAWDQVNKRLLYAGQDGRLQYFAQIGSDWQHFWLDDYWRTNEFATFDNQSMNTTQYSSLSVSGSGLPFYCGQDKHLRYFQQGPCENLNPPRQSGN